jgi:hydroxymethylpyrimidine kinase/phosphomethylpyrimidine kinase/thiamine-phosphate diphosphorylase
MNTLASPPPIAWTIAGSDPAAGAGIQADIKTMHAFGVYGCSVITALTAQNSQLVDQVEPVSPSLLARQIDLLIHDFPPQGLKIGMLPTQNLIETLLQAMSTLPSSVITLYDPVLIATTGKSLLCEDTLTLIREKLLPRLDWLTPNRPEAEWLLGRSIVTQSDMEGAAHDLHAMGVHQVLLKGGHVEGKDAVDYWTDGSQSAWVSSPRIKTRHTHGTGCTLSSAIIASLVSGYSPMDAVVIAKAYVNQGLRQAPQLGQGHGPLHHGPFPKTFIDLPRFYLDGDRRDALHFPAIGPQPPGFYPVIDRASWLNTLLPLGVRTVQLRIKDLTGDALETEIQQAITWAKSANCHLFINDHWKQALTYGAYGVHLGQTDLMQADLQAVSQAGLRLGVSTHCWWEVARAAALNPSYLAIGPVFETSTK